MTNTRLLSWALVLIGALWCSSPISAETVVTPPDGFKALFNGSDLAGWTGGTTRDPLEIRALPKEEAKAWRAKMNRGVAEHWRVEAGQIISDGHGPHLVTERDYGDFELWVDWKLSANGDSGIYLRGCPQVQLWDPGNKAEHKNGADKGSGGLWNNKKSGRFPSEVADKPTEQWNRMYIRMVGPYVTVKLNGKTVLDNAEMENYFASSRPVPMVGPIHLQTHGSETRFRNLFIRELGAEEANAILIGIAGDEKGYTSIFNGKDLSGWVGRLDGYEVIGGAIVCKPGAGGNIFTEATYQDYAVRMEFKLPPAGNNGLAIRSPDARRYVMEIQVLDNTDPKYVNLKKSQYHGSLYGVMPALRGYLRPVGEWNTQEVRIVGDHITVDLNGYRILDVQVSKVAPRHPLTKTSKGHFGFLGHKDPVAFRNIRIKELEQ